MATYSGYSTEMECELCHENLKSPKLLNCLHSFCATPCLKNATKIEENGQVIVCPTCQTTTQIPEDDINALTTNIFASRYLDAVSLQTSCLEESACGDCSEDDSATTAFCQECGNFLCEFCKLSHKRRTNTKHHHLLSIEEFRRASPESIISLSSPDTCEEHDSKVKKMFCATCEASVCPDCVMKKTCEEAKPEIHDLIQNVQNVSKKLKDAVVSVQCMEARVRDSADHEVQEVNIAFDEIMAALLARKEEIIQLVRETKEAKLEKLGEQVKGFQHELDIVKECIKFSEQLLERDGSFEIVNLTKCVQKRLNYLFEKERDYDMCENNFLVFRRVNVDDTLEMFKEMGTIISTVWPARCTVEKMPGKLFSNFRNTFQIIIRDIKDNRVVCDGLSEEISVVVTECETKETTIGDVQDNLDGSYSVTYQVGQVHNSGKYQIEVMLLGDHIKGSPFQMRNYTRPSPKHCKLQPLDLSEIIMRGDYTKLEYLLETFAETGLRTDDGGDSVEMIVDCTDVKSKSLKSKRRGKVVDYGDGTYGLSCDVIDPGFFSSMCCY